MSTMKSLRVILSELRKNPDLNPRLTNAQNLEKYKDDENIFITFSNHELATFNLKSVYDTPLGIYCYPLKQMWKEIETDEIPFAADRGFIHVLKNTSSSFIDDIGNLPNAEGVKLIDKLLSLFVGIFINETPEVQKELQRHMSTQMVESIAKELELYKISNNKETIIDNISHDLKRFLLPKFENSCYHKNNIGGLFWWYSKRFADQLSYANTKKFGGKPPSFIWREVLVSLGIAGVADRTGKGIIHSNEPLQAVFFTPKAFQHLETFINDVRTVDVHKAKINDKIYKTLDRKGIKGEDGYRHEVLPKGDKADRYLKHGKLEVEYNKLNNDQRAKYHGLIIKKANMAQYFNQKTYSIMKNFSEQEIADFITAASNSVSYPLPQVILERINSNIIKLLSPETLNKILNIYLNNKLTQDAYNALTGEQKAQYDANLVRKDKTNLFLK